MGVGVGVHVDGQTFAQAVGSAGASREGWPLPQESKGEAHTHRHSCRPTPAAASPPSTCQTAAGAAAGGRAVGRGGAAAAAAPSVGSSTAAAAPSLEHVAHACHSSGQMGCGEASHLHTASVARACRASNAVLAVWNDASATDRLTIPPARCAVERCEAAEGGFARVRELPLLQQAGN